MAKSKYMMHHCAYCHKETKMELVGGMPAESDAGPQRLWYRCTRCKHSALITLEAPSTEKKSVARIERADCTEYSKEKVFTIGQAIYYAELDDMGRVVRKDKTSNGLQSIVVSFENCGERKLVENFKAEYSDELNQSVAS